MGPNSPSSAEVRNRVGELQRKIEEKQRQKTFVDAARNGDHQRVQDLITEGVEVAGILGAQALGAALQGAADQHSIQMLDNKVIGRTKRPSKNRQGCLRVAQRLLELGVNPNEIRIQGYEAAGAKDLGGGVMLYSTGKPGTVVLAPANGLSLLEYAEREDLSEFVALLRNHESP